MAVFVPDPEVDLQELVDQLGWELAERYRDAEEVLLREIARRIYRDIQLQQLDPGVIVPGGLTAAQRRKQNRVLALLQRHRAEALRELQFLAAQIVEKLQARELAEQLIELAAREGDAAAVARLGLARRLPNANVPLPWLGGSVDIAAVTLNGSAVQAVGSLVFSLQSRLEFLNQRITRYPQDVYQRVVSQFTPRTLLGVATSLQQQQAIVQQFLSQGITGFVDRAGRNWRIGSYAEMAGRTSVIRAYNDAGIWRMQQSGINLVTIVGGFDACKRCAPWIGKILSTDGTPAGPVILPHATENRSVTVTVHGTLDQARNAGWGHPNCRDKVVAYLPGLTVPQAGFEHDPEKERARERLRELERDVRQAKRDMDLAPNDIARRKAEREVREAQAAIRDHLARNPGLNRARYREQVGFAGPAGVGPAGGPKTPKPPRGGPNINIDAGTPLGADVRAARSSIAKVHRIPSSLAPLDVRSASMRAGRNGYFDPRTFELVMSPTGSSPRLTFAHEIGHYLDHQLLGTSAGYEMVKQSDPLTKKFLDTVRSSPSVKGLIDGEWDAGLRNHIEYLLDGRELWGRAYAQYIALRSDDALMLAEIAAYRSSENLWTALRQWDMTEFEPIADVIDEIFRSKGILK